ncbi:hypothetical protein QTP88_007319 [Uroleucon formosanum]
MATITLVAALFCCLLLHSFALSSTASRTPESDLPFEFNHGKGSVINDDNVLVQSVSSDGKNVLKINDPQPIKKYQYVNTNNKRPSKNQDLNRKQRIQNNPASGIIMFPAEHLSTSHHTTFPTINGNNFFEYFSKYFPGLSNVRIVYN